MGNALVYIGANELDLPGIRWAREAGLEVHVTDPDEQAAGRRLADRFHALAPRDAEGHLALAEKLGKRLAGAYTSSDDGLETVALIGEASGIPATPRAVVRASLAPKTPSSSSALVRGGRKTRHLDVNAFFRDGVFVPAGIGESFFLPSSPEPTRDWGCVPASLNPGESDEIYDLCERSARSIGITIGPVMAQVISSPAGLALRSLKPRFQSNFVTACTTPLCYGKSPIQAWFATLAGAGGPFDAMPLVPERAAGWIAIHALQDGLLRGLEGGERARLVPGFERLTRVKRPGASVGRKSYETSLIAFLWACGENPSEVEERLRRARSCLEVKVESRSVA